MLLCRRPFPPCTRGAYGPQRAGRSFLRRSPWSAPRDRPGLLMHLPSPPPPPLLLQAHQPPPPSPQPPQAIEEHQPTQRSRATAPRRALARSECRASSQQQTTPNRLRYPVRTHRYMRPQRQPQRKADKGFARERSQCLPPAQPTTKYQRAGRGELQNHAAHHNRRPTASLQRATHRFVQSAICKVCFFLGGGRGALDK